MEVAKLAWDRGAFVGSTYGVAVPSRARQFFSAWDNSITIFISCCGLFDATMLGYYCQTLPRTSYTNVAWEQRVSSTWNEPGYVAGAFAVVS